MCEKPSPSFKSAVKKIETGEELNRAELADWLVRLVGYPVWERTIRKPSLPPCRFSLLTIELRSRLAFSNEKLVGSLHSPSLLCSFAQTGCRLRRAGTQSTERCLLLPSSSTLVEVQSQLVLPIAVALVVLSFVPPLHRFGRAHSSKRRIILLKTLPSLLAPLGRSVCHSPPVFVCLASLRPS